MCVVPDALEHIRGEGNPLIDETTCSEVGQPLNEPSLQQLQVYPPKNVIFYGQIPYMRRHVMIQRSTSSLLTWGSASPPAITLQQ